MSAGLKIGGTEVLKPGQSETWSSSMLKQRMLKTYGDDLVMDVDIAVVNQTTETTNEFLSTVRQRETPENGYVKFGPSLFQSLKTPLEESVLESIKEKLAHVQEFKVS